uniref:Taperin n=1 Tax=Myripristis murdjan TaxID=586833 RepID=A0A667YHI0_9TELE
MSGGEVRVLRQEAGQESPRMPAWKREILERRKAKGGGSGGGAAAGAAEVCPGAGAQRVNGEVTATGGGGGVRRDAGTSSGSSASRNYTITTASQHFASKRGSLASPDLSPVRTNNKEPWTAAEAHDPAERTGRDGDGQESLVLQDSLGPLQENPFIKLEKERKRRQDRENAARPVPHILELYGSVPGIRTIRAENIIIIESDPDYFTEASGLKAGSKLQQNGVSSYSSLNDLLDRRGSAVTEIRAKEVVIYDTTLSKSEENLSTLGRPDEGPSYATGAGQGRVSQILQKFDSNYGKLQKKSRSTENLLDLESSSSSRPRLRPKPQPDLVPKHVLHPQPGSPVRNLGSTQPSPVFQSTQSSKPKPQPAASETDGPHRPAGPPQSVSSFRQRFEGGGGRGVVVISRDEADRGQPRSPRERDWESTEVPPKPKVPCSPETSRARAESPTNFISSKASHPSPEFEIRPSPKPDLSRIPEGDTQARALANLRLQSRNSFTVIPRRHSAAPATPGSSAPSVTVMSPPSHRAAEVPMPGVPTSHTPTPTSASSKMNQEKVREEEKPARPLAKPDLPPSVTATPTPPSTPTPSPPSPTLTQAPSSPPASPQQSPLHLPRLPSALPLLPHLHPLSLLPPLQRNLLRNSCQSPT